MDFFQASRLLSEKPLEVGVFESWSIAIASILGMLLGAIATSAGIGGGGLFVPVYALVLGYGVKAAVPLSQATILGGAIGKYLSTSRLKHPYADRPVIDYNLATMMQSWELLGTVFGVLFNTIFPELLIIIILVFVLGTSSYKTFKKGLQYYKQETKLKNDDNFSQPNQPVKQEIKEAELDIEINAEINKVAVNEATLAEEKLEAKTFPEWQMVTLSAMTLFIVLYSLVKKGVLGSIEPCGVGYWVWYFVPLPFFIGIGFLVGQKLLKISKRKELMRYQYLEGDLKWNLETLRKMPLIGFLTGVTASLVGIGGGMIIVPLFLELGVIPEVSSTTNAFIILFVGLSSVVQYSILDWLPWDYALWFIFVGFIGAQFGHHSLKKILQQTGRSSIICFILAVFIAASVLAMFINGIISLSSTPSKEIFEFSTSEVCGGSH